MKQSTVNVLYDEPKMLIFFPARGEVHSTMWELEKIKLYTTTVAILSEFSIEADPSLTNLERFIFVIIFIEMLCRFIHGDIGFWVNVLYNESCL